MSRLRNLKIKIFADTANLNEIKEVYLQKHVQGVTTNPSLLKSAGVKNYEQFAKEVLKLVTDKAVSFEVFSDDPQEIEEQALIISSWGENVYVKVPIMNTKKRFLGDVIKRLTDKGVKVNVTAVFTIDQVEKTLPNLSSKTKSIISIFAGRIADAGQNPEPLIIEVLKKAAVNKNVEILWASTRESYNIIQADNIGCHIITVPYSQLKKISLFGKDLNEYTLETVEMFYNDAKASGFSIKQTVNVL